MLTQDRKIELLGLCRDIGLKLTTLESVSYVEDIAKPQVAGLRSALEIVRSKIVTAPIREPRTEPRTLPVFTIPMRDTRTGD
jgi:hypothetical protein